MFDPTASAVRALRSDRRHGAAEIASAALEALARHAAEAPADDADALAGSLAEAARELAGARPTMAPLATQLAAAHQGVRASRDVAPDLEDLRDHAAEAARAVRDTARADAHAAAQHAADLAAGATVLTVSRSSTVRPALEAADRVVVAASRPGGEGREVAEELAGARDVVLVPDAAVPAAVDELDVDRVLVGADAVLEDGTVVNKTGTRSACLAARDAGVPAHAVASTWKITPWSHVDGEDAAFQPPPGVRAFAPAFEATPPRLVDGLVTEDGVVGLDTVGEAAHRHRDALAELGV